MPLEWVSRVQFISNADGGGIYEGLLAGTCRLIKLFVDRGVDIETRGHNHMTPLHIASKAGLLDTVRLLVDSRAHILAKNGLRYHWLSLKTTQMWPSCCSKQTQMEEPLTFLVSTMALTTASHELPLLT
jgi:ankyrin repeat protein